MRGIFLLVSVMFSFMCSSAAFAQGLEAPAEKLELQVFPIGSEVRYEQNTSLEWVGRNSWNYALGLQKVAWSFLVEYSSFTENSGNATLSTERKFQEAVAWGQWHFLRSQTEQWGYSFFGGLGLGGYQEEVLTSLSGTVRNDSSGVKWMSGLALGAEVKVYLNKTFGFMGSLEGRALTAPDFDSNPTWSGVLRLGLILSL